MASKKHWQELEGNARDLLEKVRVEIVQRGHEVTTRPQNIQVRDVGRRNQSIIAIDGVEIDAFIHQDFRRQGYLSSIIDGLEFGVDWIRDGVSFSSKLNAVTFRKAKSRSATYGFDVKRIADHLIHWATTKRAVDEVEAKHETALNMWTSAVDRLKQRFKLPGSVHLEPTAKGIEIQILTDERHAVEMLRSVFRDELADVPNGKRK